MYGNEYKRHSSSHGKTDVKFRYVSFHILPLVTRVGIDLKADDNAVLIKSKNLSKQKIIEIRDEPVRAL